MTAELLVECKCKFIRAKQEQASKKLEKTTLHIVETSVLSLWHRTIFGQGVPLLVTKIGLAGLFLQGPVSFFCDRSIVAASYTRDSDTVTHANYSVDLERYIATYMKYILFTKWMKSKGFHSTMFILV